MPVDDLLSTLFENIAGIAETRQVIEQVDLIRADGATCVRLRALNRLTVASALDLIELVENNGENLRGLLEAMLRDS